MKMSLMNLFFWSRPMRLMAALVCCWLVSSVAAEGTTKAGREYLAEKAQEPGIVKLESGLLYKELRAGFGKIPGPDSHVKCHYSGRLLTGKEFDSSYKRDHPLEFAVTEVIPGWQEALQLMPEGAKWELYIPSELGYGDEGAGSLIPGGAVLIFDIELLEIIKH